MVFFADFEVGFDYLEYVAVPVLKTLSKKLYVWRMIPVIG